MKKQNEIFLENVVAISEIAGKAIMDIYSRSDVGITYKNGGSPLTIADKKAHYIILEQLKKISPDIPVLSEESSNIPYNVRKSWKTFWLVDPLDGTKEFIKKNGEFTVNIALIDNKSVMLGVVHAPALNITYFAERGKGSFKKDSKGFEKKLEIPHAGCHGGRLKIVASRSHGGRMQEQFLLKIEDADFISMGSSLKLCLVAEGKAHLYPRLGPTMEWDTAAAQCIVELAGGSVTDLNKQSLVYNKPDLLNPYFMVSGSSPFPWWKYIDNILEKEEKQ